MGRRGRGGLGCAGHVQVPNGRSRPLRPPVFLVAAHTILSEGEALGLDVVLLHQLREEDLWTRSPMG